MSSTRLRPSPKGRSRSSRTDPRAEPASASKASLHVFWLPFAFTLGLLLLSLLPRIQSNPTLTRSFWVAAGALLLWQAVLFLYLRREGSSRTLAFPAPRPQHYLQAMVHLSVYTYWGTHWEPIQDYAWLLVAQLVFAYAFDILLGWSRRQSYPLGFGAFPIIFSTNLFLWFRDDWFYLQFLMIAVGFLGKEFVRWNREGRKVHIFNPSAFSLGLFSLALIATNTTHLTWGPQIASQLTLAPRIYLFLFLVGLVVMYFFSITLVVMAAAGTLFGFSAIYSAATGVPYFLDSEIPSAVFLGILLLITDPSTSPRTPPGKIIFGALYGLGVFALYGLLGMIGAPTFYDKLLCVPLLNLSVQRIDRLVQPLQERAMVARLHLDRISKRGNLAHMSVWVLFFGAMTVLGRTDGRQPGDSLPFWEAACEEGLRNGCERLVQVKNTYCTDNSPWACNELGIHYRQGTLVEADPERALGYFARACEGKFQAGCLNLLEPAAEYRADPGELDLRLLLRERGKNLLTMPVPELYARACDHRWGFACERVGRS